MELLVFALLWSGACVLSSLAFPPPQHVGQNAILQKVLLNRRYSSKAEQQKTQSVKREQVNTVRVTCHPDSLEIVIKADMFGVGAPVNSDELRLGVKENNFCKATVTSGEEYAIVVGLTDCGTKHWMTEDSLVYTNLLIYSPLASTDGLVRMEEAVVPIECHYERKYSLSSSSLTPTWAPFMSTQAAVELLEFDLRIMTDDWLYERSSNVFFLGDAINVEASVNVGHHMGLKVFVTGCVATLTPDIHSTPRYVFLENGCLLDSQLLGSRSSFLPRRQDDKLQMVIDAFRFHNEDRAELYITCHLNAVPLNDADSLNKACTFVNGRWQSADGNDYLCGYCQSQNEPEQTHSLPGKFGPRGFGKPDQSESFWRSGLKMSKVLEQEARVGPVVVLPARHKSIPLPEKELPPVLNKISRPALYGSHWRSRVNRPQDQKGLDSVPPKLDQVEEPEEDEPDLEDEDLEYEDTEDTMKTGSDGIDVNATAAPNGTTITTRVQLNMTSQSNTTVVETDLSAPNEPKR